jgi:murein L,D-transpeptidase YafK
VWKQDRSGRFALLKTYPICRWSGELGPKIKEGDRQAPEGFYTITPGQMNPNSQFYLAFDLGYPNAFDRSHGRTGAHLMVHGDCSSRGCYSMTDEQITEIYGLGREAFFGGQRSFQVQAYPFRMTAQNMAKHRANPHMAFWKMLKKGNDHFEVTRLETKVDVCEKRYVFDAQNPSDPSRSLSFSAAGKCPVYEVPSDVADAVQDKQRRDEFQTAELITRGTPVSPIRTNADGGMHPVFAAAVKRNEVGVAPGGFTLASVPGTIPAHVRPPQTPEFAAYSGADSVAAPVAAPTTMRSGTSAAQPVRVASAATSGETVEVAVPASGSGNLFGNLFSSSSSKTSSAVSKKDDANALTRMARFIGLRGSDPEPEPPEAVPTPKKPAARPVKTAAAPGAIRPKQEAAEQPVRQAAAPAPAPAAAPATVMSGAAAPMPTGSFDSRWSAFR